VSLHRAYSILDIFGTWYESQRQGLAIPVCVAMIFTDNPRFAPNFSFSTRGFS